MIDRTDLTDDEWEWLLRIHRQDAALLTVEMRDRLESLGVIKPALGGSMVSMPGLGLIMREFGIGYARPRPLVRLSPDVNERLEHERLMERRRGR